MVLLILKKVIRFGVTQYHKIKTSSIEQSAIINRTLNNTHNAIVLHVSAMKCVVYICCIKEAWTGSILTRNFLLVKVMHNFRLQNPITMIISDKHV